MGDRFYEQQKAYKPKRRLKKDVIAELTKVLGGREVKGLDRCTIQTLDDLTEAIERAKYED
jgi:hypothetical protein